MPKLSKKNRLIQEILSNRYDEEKHMDYTKYYNVNFEILKHKTFYIVLDKREFGLTKMYNNLEIAHEHIVKSQTM